MAAYFGVIRRELAAKGFSQAFINNLETILTTANSASDTADTATTDLATLQVDVTALQTEVDAIEPDSALLAPLASGELPGGASGQVQYNSNGVFGGFTLSGDGTLDTSTGVFTLATVPVLKGGTGATTAAGARTNLGLAIGTDVQAFDSDLSAVAGLSTTGLMVRTGTGTATTRTLTAPAAGITVSNGDGVSGNPTLALANDLAALEALSGTNTIYYRSGVDTWSAVTFSGLTFSGGVLAASGTTPDLTGSTGLVAQTASGTYSARTLTAPAAGITVSNGSGVSGNPTLALANDLAALEALSSTGLAARTGSDAWAQRTITAPAAGITVSNGDGASGNPTLALANDLSAVEGLSGTGVAVRTGTDAWNVRTLTAGAGITISNGDGSGGNPTITAVGSGISGAAPYVYTNAPFANVTSLLHFDGTNGSTTITDQVLTAWTAVGSATISTAQSVYGGASLLVPSGSNSSVKHATSSGFDVGTGDWAIEFRWFYNGAPQTSARVFQSRDGDVVSGIGIYVGSTGQLTLSLSSAAASFDILNQAIVTLSQTVWNTVIIQRRGAFLECFLNGSLAVSFTIGSQSIYYNSGDTVIIGGNATGTSRSMNAYMDEFRFTKGAYVMVPGDPGLRTSAFPNS